MNAFRLPRRFILAAMLTTAMPLRAAEPLAEALAWLQRSDAELTKPRYGELDAAGLAALTELRLGGHRRSDKKHLYTEPAGFAHLRALPALRSLHLGENDGATDAALAHVGTLTQLQSLVLWDAPVTDGGLRQLVGLQQLKVLDLAFATRLTTAALDSVTRLPRLERLVLAGTQVDDVSSLTALGSLRQLKLGKLQPRGLDALRRANPALVIE